MSKAFTREETDGPDIPDLPPLASTLAPGARNYITAAGGVADGAGGGVGVGVGLGSGGMIFSQW